MANRHPFGLSAGGDMSMGKQRRTQEAHRKRISKGGEANE